MRWRWTIAGLAAAVLLPVGCGESAERAPAEGGARTGAQTVEVTQEVTRDVTQEVTVEVTEEAPSGPATARESAASSSVAAGTTTSVSGDVAAAGPGEDSPCGEEPQAVLVEQYEHINTGEYESAYAFFADVSKVLVTPEQYRAFFEANAPYSVTGYSFPSVDVTGETATVTVEFTATSSGVAEALTRTQELVCEFGSWRVVMRHEQVTAFLETGQEGQYEGGSDEGSSSGPDGDRSYPPFPGDPYGDRTCKEVGGGPYSVPPGSPRDADGDGVACEPPP